MRFAALEPEPTPDGAGEASKEPDADPEGEGEALSQTAESRELEEAA